MSPVRHSKPYLKDKQREANWDSRGKHPLPITRSIQEAERLPGGKYYIPLKRKKNDYETPITGAPLGEIGTYIMSLFLSTSSLHPLYSVMMATNMMRMMSILTSASASSLCFLLSFYSYTPHFLLPSPCLPYLTIPLL